MKKLHLLSILMLASILTLNAQPEGALKGIFSVSASKKVCFAKGNLQYQASTNTWRFAENQYDALTTENTKVSATYDGWIDLFGWGTSGYNEKYPYMTSYDPTEYGNGSNEIEKTMYDWGLYNPIANGGNKAGQWRTPTLNEWYYIIVRRANADSLHGLACVNGVNGLIILPDNWTTPEDLTFNPGGVSEDNYDADHYKTINEYSLEQWKLSVPYSSLQLVSDSYMKMVISTFIALKLTDTIGSQHLIKMKRLLYSILVLHLSHQMLHTRVKVVLLYVLSPTTHRLQQTLPTSTLLQSCYTQQTIRCTSKTLIQTTKYSTCVAR